MTRKHTGAHRTVGAIARMTAGLISAGLFFWALRISAEVPAVPPQRVAATAADHAVERGRYLVQIGGCNDCHTAGYPERSGDVPTREWLTGSRVGFQGPWGTSYPSNLRLTVSGLTEEQWLQFARAQRLPPMPWFNLKAMSDDDLRAVYRFIRQLGPKGERAPAAVAPGSRVTTPFIVFEPRGEEIASSTTTAAPSASMR